jgi:gamma-glutamylcyclotransferase (GGCT)/AIG2-like uncharacterized protein YtfP
MLYFSYGMNTNPKEMAQRCPGAKSLGHARLVNHSFRFARHADVEPCADSFVDGVLWEITDEHLKALDQLEGYPFYYDRVVSSVVHGTRTFHALVYRMQSGHQIDKPTRGYYELVYNGYQAHNVPTDQLENSLEFRDIEFG